MVRKRFTADEKQIVTRFLLTVAVIAVLIATSKML